jgi:hypothetical protein
MATAEQLRMVPEVPKIMRAKGWTVAATLMEAWQAGTAHDFATYNVSHPYQRHAYLTPIRMGWVLGFDRAKSVFDSIFSQGPLTRPETWTRLRTLLNSGGNSSGSGHFNFIHGHPREIESRGEVLSEKAAGTPLRQHAAGVADWRTPEVRVPRVEVRIPDQVPIIGGRRVGAGGQRVIPSVPVGSGLDQASQFLTLDDLTGALARFTFCVTARGSYVKHAGVVNAIEIEELGVYVRDSFDFVGADQPLGAWKASPPDVSFAPRHLIPKSDWVWLDNGVFQDWRAKNGHGRDFIVYSDIRRVRMATPVRVTFGTPARTPVPAGAR